MRVWTYLRPFEYRGLDCVVEVTLTFKETISRLFGQPLGLDPAPIRGLLPEWFAAYAQ